MSFYRKSRHSVSHINTWTVSLQYSSTDSGKKMLPGWGMCLVMCKEQSNLTKETREWTKCPALQERLLRKKNKNHLLSSFQKIESMQTTGSVFAEK